MSTASENARPDWPQWADGSNDSAQWTEDRVDFRALGYVLGNTCLWHGRSLRFYSLAQHALTVCNAAQGLGGLGENERNTLALHALLADAWRAWVPERPGADMPAKALDKWTRDRAAVQGVVLNAAGVEGELPETWAQALGLTQRMAEAAVARDLADAGIDWGANDGGPLFPPLREKVRPMRPERAAERWIATFDGLRPEGLRRAGGDPAQTPTAEGGES